MENLGFEQNFCFGFLRGFVLYIRRERENKRDED